MQRRVVATGAGVISPIGNTLETFWDSLKNGRSGTKRLTYFDTAEFPSKVAGMADDFKPEDQKKLAWVFRALDDKGCKVMLSNSDTPFVRELYKDYRVETVHAARAINRDASKRGLVTEIVALNY